jgi:hypothetical protein
MSRPVKYANPADHPNARRFAPEGGVSIAGRYHLGGEALLPQDLAGLTGSDLDTLIDLAITDPAVAAQVFGSPDAMPGKDPGQRPTVGGRTLPNRLNHPGDYPHLTVGHDRRPLDESIRPRRITGNRNARPSSPLQGRDRLPPELRPFVTDEDALALTPQHATNLVRLFNDLPPTEEFAGAALLGRAKRGWYEDAANAIVGLFGSEAPRFTALLAATSPVKSVQANLRNAVAIWEQWQAMRKQAGRDPSRQELETWLRDHFELTGGERTNAWDQKSKERGYHRVFRGGEYYLDTEIPNIVRALTKPDPHQTDHLSGPTVSSLNNNLLGNLAQVTNDVWMAAFAGIPQGDIGGRTSRDSQGAQTVRDGRYIALSAKQRQAAHMLNQTLGPDERAWQPAEIQETVWSAMRALSYLVGAGRSRSRKNPRVDALHTPDSALDALTHEFVAGNTDFVTLLLKDQATRETLGRLGFGKALDRLQRAAEDPASPPLTGRAVQGVPGVYQDPLRRVAGRAAIAGRTHTRPGVTLGRKGKSKVRYADQYVGTSGNQDTDLTFEQALHRSRSGDQKVFRQHLDGMIKQQGLKATSHTAIGDWEDGAEHSVLSQFDGTADRDRLKYLAAWSGLLGNQRSVLLFHPDPQGLDSSYDIKVPETDLMKVRQALSTAGVPFRTIIPGKSHSRVIVYDQKRKLRDNVSKFAGGYGATVRESIGHGEYVGGGSRTDARRKYRDIIARFEAAARGEVRPG